MGFDRLFPSPLYATLNLETIQYIVYFKLIRSFYNCVVFLLFFQFDLMTFLLTPSIWSCWSLDHLYNLSRSKRAWQLLNLCTCSVYLSRHLNQETMKGLFRSSSQAPTVTTCLTTQQWRHPVKCLAQDHNKRTCRLVIHTIPLLL